MLGLFRELEDFFGDDRESAPLLAGACSLDRGVESQEVGLLGDAGDGVDEGADLLRLGCQLADRRRRLLRGLTDRLHRFGRLAGGFHTVARQPPGLLGRSRRLVRRAGAFGDRSHGFFDRLAHFTDALDLRLRTLGHVADRRSDLVDRARSLV